MSKHKSQEKMKMSEIDEQILKIFDIKKRLGKGAYGIVWKAIDKKTTQIVAVKKIFDAFRNETDAQRTFREIMFLRAFRNHDNIIQLHSIHRAANHLDIYLSFEFMESDLHNVIKRGTILKDVHKRYVMYQLFNATNYIHSGNVIHRDLKPSNVLIDSRCRCKIADFGLARSVSPNVNDDNLHIEQMLTDYVATRWYRAPEILVASKSYTKGIDLWSLGCILAEMIRGKPIFPGSCTVNQVERIVSALPEVTESDIKSVGSGFGSALLNQGSTDSIKLDELLITSPDDAKHLVKSLLILDPTQRLTAKEAMDHKYIEKFRHVLPEPELTIDIIPPFRDDIQLSVQEYRTKLYELISSSERSGGKTSNNSVSKKRETATNHKSEYSAYIENKQRTNHVNKKDYSNSKLINMEHSINDSKITPGYSKSTESNNFLKKPDYKNRLNQSRVHQSPDTNNNKTLPKTLSNQNGTFIENYEKPRIPKKGTQSLTCSMLDSCEISTIPNNKTDSDIKLLRRSSFDGNITVLPTASSGTNSFKSDYSSYQNNKFIDINNKSSPDVSSNYFINSAKYQNYCQNNHQKIQCNNSRYNNSTKLCRDSSGIDVHVDNVKNKITAPSITKKYNQNRQSSEEKSPSYNSTEPIVMSNANDMLTQIYYENRLKHLEEKINKHKTDMKTFLSQNNTKSTNNNNTNKFRCKSIMQISDPLKCRGTSRTDLIRTKSENTGYRNYSKSSKSDFPYADVNGTSKHNINRRDSNYGVIKASELYKLNKTEMIL